MDGRDHQGRWAYELEALGQAALIRLVRAEIEAWQPLSRVQERQDGEREELRDLLDEMGSEGD